MLDVKRLKQEIRRSNISEKELCGALGVKYPEFIENLSSETLNTSEAEKITRILNIKEPWKIFFANNLHT